MENGTKAIAGCRFVLVVLQKFSSIEPVDARLVRLVRIVAFQPPIVLGFPVCDERSRGYIVGTKSAQRSDNENFEF